MENLKPYTSDVDQLKAVMSILVDVNCFDLFTVISDRTITFSVKPEYRGLYSELMPFLYFYCQVFYGSRKSYKGIDVHEITVDNKRARKITLKLGEPSSVFLDERALIQCIAVVLSIKQQAKIKPVQSKPMFDMVMSRIEAKLLETGASVKDIEMKLAAEFAKK